MSLVKLKDRRTGTTYVYESKSYWDKEKKQPRLLRPIFYDLQLPWLIVADLPDIMT